MKYSLAICIKKLANKPIKVDVKAFTIDFLKKKYIVDALCSEDGTTSHVAKRSKEWRL